MSDPQPGPYSLFAPPGLAQHAAGKPLAQAIHETALALFSKYGAESGGLSTEEGSFVDLFSFALAIAFARVGRTLERADGERFADSAYYLLAQFESEYGLRPSAEDRLHTRRAALGDAKQAPRGNTRPELEQQLRDTLGDSYVGLHIASGAEVVAWPEELADQPQNLLEASVERKLVTIGPAISAGLGAPQQVRYVPVSPAPATGHSLAIGDKIVVEPEMLHRAEVVTVTALAIDDPDLLFTATFNNAHEPGCVAAQMPFPVWTSTQRAILVAIADATISDPETRRKANEKLAKILTGVTTWSLCGMSGVDTIGPWTIGDPRLGQIGHNPIGTFTIL